MSFEEFFKKKKISLSALQQGDAALFSEFKDHYELMGEKSFDHTKKYWFNSLRHLYPLPPEVKAEKVVIENRLAEQTIAETLADSIVQQEKKVGFTPRFKAGATATKPAEATDLPKKELNTPSEEAASKPEQSLEPSEPQKTPPKGFTPRFKAGATTVKKEEPINADDKPAETDKPVEPAKAPAGFKPRFKAGVTKAQTSDVPPGGQNIKDSATVTPEVNETAEEQSKILERDPEVDINQVKPAFEKEKEQAQDNFGSEERVPKHFSPEEIVESKGEAVEPGEDKPAAAKIGFKPRFKAGVTNVKKDEQSALQTTEPEPDQSTPEAKDQAQQPDAPAAPKIGFKPRFKPPQQ